MGTCQCDPLGKALFDLTRFRASCSTTSDLPSCLFSSIANDIHIIGPPSIVSFAYTHFQTQFRVIDFFIQPPKCVTWSLSNLPPNFDTPS
jgi:hypothetical protein